MSDSASGEYGDQYAFATLLRRVTSVPDAGMQLAQLRRHLLGVPPEIVARHLQELLTHNARGNRDATQAVLAFGRLMMQTTAEDELAVEAVNIAARVEGLHAVGWLLLEPPPARELDELKMQRMRGKAMTLGARRAAAAGHDRRLLEALLSDHDPRVIERLCANPRVNQGQMLNIATRRPVRPEILHVIAQSPRWHLDVRVRGALAQNPYIATGVALRMLPTLPLDTIHHIRFATDLHEHLRQAAEYFVRLRESEPDAPAPGEPAPPRG